MCMSMDMGFVVCCASQLGSLFGSFDGCLLSDDMTRLWIDLLCSMY
jgi:hypothetical protein